MGTGVGIGILYHPVYYLHVLYNGVSVIALLARSGCFLGGLQ